MARSPARRLRLTSRRNWRPTLVERGCGDPRQPRRPQECEGRAMSEATRGLVSVSARLFARSQPNRAGFRKDQSTPAQSRSPNRRRALASRRRHLQLVRAAGMLELPQGRRICVRVSVRCSMYIARWCSAATAQPGCDKRAGKMDRRVHDEREACLGTPIVQQESWLWRETAIPLIGGLNRYSSFEIERAPL